MKHNRRTFNLIYILTALFIALSFIALAFNPIRAAADELSEVEKDLQRMTINGAPFNAADYPAAEDGAPALILLEEQFYNEDGTGDYALNLYLHNPSKLSVQRDSQKHAVQMTVGNAARPAKYGIKLLSVSADKLFLKFSVTLNGAEKAAVLDSLSADSRAYDVHSVELHVSGYNATDYAIERKFIYTGYYGDGLTCTLNYTTVGGMETQQLECFHTAWRPEGTNGKDEYTQDSLESVYFAIPNELNERYDYLNSVHCQWLEAVLAPMFVTSYESFVDDLCTYIESGSYYLDDGQVITGADGGGLYAPEKFDWQKFNYSVLGDPSYANEHNKIYEGGYGFGKTRSGNAFFGYVSIDEMIDRLFGAFYDETGDGHVSSGRLLEEIQRWASSPKFHNDKAVAGKYPSYLFESYDRAMRDETIYLDFSNKNLKMDMVSEVNKTTAWQRLIGQSNVTIGNYTKEQIQAIREVRPMDLRGTPEQVSNRLFIGANDVEDFTKFFDNNSKGKTIYLLRLGVTDYTRRYARVFKWASNGSFNLDSVGKGYTFQETVYLDFDVIDLEFKKNDVSHVVPVVMSPIDITPAPTPPPEYLPPARETPFWKVGCAIIGALVAVGIVYGIGKAVVIKGANRL